MGQGGKGFRGYGRLGEALRRCIAGRSTMSDYARYAG